MDLDAQGKYGQVLGGLVRHRTIDPGRKGVGLPQCLLVSKTTRTAACFCSPRDLNGPSCVPQPPKLPGGWGAALIPTPTSFVVMGSMVGVT